METLPFRQVGFRSNQRFQRKIQRSIRPLWCAWLLSVKLVSTSLTLFSQVQSHIAVRGMIEQMDVRQQKIQEELHARRSESDTSAFVDQDSHLPQRSSKGPRPTVNTSVIRSGQDPEYTTSPLSMTPYSNPNPFGGLFSSSSMTGNITFNNVSGNSHVVTNNNNRSTTNSRNTHYNTAVGTNNRVITARYTC